MSHNLIEIRDLHKSYISRGFSRQRADVLRGVSFGIGPSKIVALVGGSGSGKSTTARCILQLDRPDRGAVLFDNYDLCKLRGGALRRVRRRMQAVFQDPLGSLDPRLSIFDSAAEPLEQEAITPAECRERVYEALRLVGLEAETRRKPGQLSGGQAQRAAIARAIVSRPELVILDEATSSLDVSIQAQILNLLRDLQDRLHLSYLFISHDLGVVNVLCDRVLVMQDGVVIEEGPTSQILRNPEHEYTARLVEAASAV
jgi:peptide/nickel transport system ATP-binding protein